jgi:hypothetical protein
MSETKPLATFDYEPGKLDDSLVFLKRIRSELRQIRMVRVWTDRFAVFDVNQDCFEIRGIGYPDKEITTILDAVNTAYKRELIHEPTDLEYKEFKTGRRYAWAADRVM